MNSGERTITHNFAEVDNSYPLITSSHFFFVLLFFDTDRALSHEVWLTPARHLVISNIIIRRTLFLTSASLTEILAVVINARTVPTPVSYTHLTLPTNREV